MKIKNLFLMLAILPFLGGCGLFVNARQDYTYDHHFDREADINVFGSIAATKESKRILLLYWSDVYSAPYSIVFNTYSKEQPNQNLIIHSVLLKNDDTVIFKSTPETPMEIGFKKGQYDHYYKAVFKKEFRESLDFVEGKELILQVDWEIPGIKRRQTFESIFIGTKSGYKCSIWTVMQSV